MVLMSLVGLVGVGSLGSVGGRGMVGRRSESLIGGGGLAGRILWSKSSSGSVASSFDPSSSSSPSPLESPSIRLLSDILPPISSSSETDFLDEASSTATYVQPSSFDNLDLDASSRQHPKDPEERPKKPPHGVPTGPEVTWQRLIGRVSAWTCTVLYLTSRMPQVSS